MKRSTRNHQTYLDTRKRLSVTDVDVKDTLHQIAHIQTKSTEHQFLLNPSNQMLLCIFKTLILMTNFKMKMSTKDICSRNLYSPTHTLKISEAIQSSV